jgi:hypothetical protein
MESNGVVKTPKLRVTKLAMMATPSNMTCVEMTVLLPAAVMASDARISLRVSWVSKPVMTVTTQMTTPASLDASRPAVVMAWSS